MCPLRPHRIACASLRYVQNAKRVPASRWLKRGCSCRTFHLATWTLCTKLTPVCWLGAHLVSGLCPIMAKRTVHTPLELDTQGYPLQTLHKQFVSKSIWKLALFDCMSQCSRSPFLYVWWQLVACVHRSGLDWGTSLPGHFDRSLMPFSNAVLICLAG